jgi:hypothetical protein
MSKRPKQNKRRKHAKAVQGRRKEQYAKVVRRFGAGLDVDLHTASGRDGSF